MNDLYVIQRQNTKAVADSIPSLRASGKWVVASYAGLHFVHAEGFANRADADQYLGKQEAENIPGNRYQLLEPTGQTAEELSQAAEGQPGVDNSGEDQSGLPTVTVEPQAAPAAPETAVQDVGASE